MPVTFEDAKARHVAGDLETAAELYRAAAAAAPGEFRALHNLGVVLEALGRPAEAETAYQDALAHGAGAWTHYNLARVRHLAGRLEAAEEGYRRALAGDDELVEAHFNLGRLLLERGAPADAEPALRRSVAALPDSAAAHNVLGDALRAQRRIGEALAPYRRAAALAPDDGAVQLDLGITLELLRRHEEAIECYRRCIVLAPAGVAAREGLARALDAIGRHDEALASVREWLVVAPGHPAALHLLAALGGSAPPPRASDAYVRETFDRFAADFDATLARLEYRAPELVAAAAERALGAAPASLDVLDLGCGTGLCAPLLRERARRLEGVDLSVEMLARAARRGGYDALHEDEITRFLADRRSCWDLIVSADTLCYFGDLAPVVTAAAHALRPGGAFVFTLEALDGDATPFRLREHGRYAHAGGHVDDVLGRCGLTVLRERHALRMEGGEPVHGWLVTATKGRTA